MTRAVSSFTFKENENDELSIDFNANNEFSILQIKFNELLKKIYEDERDKQRNLEEEVEKRTLELEDQQETFKAIYDNSKDAIAILDMKSNFLQVNPSYCEMTQMSEAEMLKISCIELTALGDIQASKDATEEVIRVGFIQNFEKSA